MSRSGLKGEVGIPIVVVVTIIVVVIVAALAFAFTNTTTTELSSTGQSMVKNVGNSLCGFFGVGQTSSCLG